MRNVNNQNVENIIKTYENMLNYMGIICPRCQNQDLRYCDTYERNVIESGKEYRIIIKRVKCFCCGKKHAIIPDFLIPYKQHTVKTINETVEKRMVAKQSTAEIEKETGVSRQLQLYWKKQFLLIKSKVETTLAVFEVEELFKILKEDQNFQIKYYQKNRKIYLMIRREIFWRYAFP